MKIWKRNAIIATVLLFVCAGIYLNWSYSETAAGADLTDTLDAGLLSDGTTLVSADTDDALLAAANEGLTDAEASTEEYFAEVRLSRQQSRDSALGVLQEAMAYDTDGTENAAAAAALEQVVSTALSEAQIESMVIAKGYADCVTYITDDTVSVAVAAPAEGLSEADAALISDVVRSQTDYPLSQVRIIEVKP